MLTDQELDEYERLIHEQEVYERRESLKDFYGDKNPNYTFLAESYTNQKYIKGQDEAGNEIDVLIAGKRGVVLEGSSRCFGPDTLVVTDRGSIPISQVRIGDYVPSIGGTKRVTATHRMPNDKKTIRIRLKNGKEIICTEDHKFFHYDKWQSIISILQEPTYLTQTGIPAPKGQFDLMNVDSWEYVECIVEVYDITVADSHCYFIDAGEPILVHNSGKTYSAIDFIIYLCLYEPKPVVINVLKETYNEFKTTLYDDFNERLTYYDLPNPFHKQEVHSFKVNGSKINLMGADKSGKDGKFHGASCDFLYINESLAVAQAIFDQSEMRCRKFWFMDYNPSVTEHYVFNSVVTRPDVGLFRTTFKDNPFVSVAERNKILGYEPWLPGSYEIIDNIIYYQGKEVDEKNQPPPHPTNVDNGTADEFMWKVYGLGLRGAMKGLIFKHVTWIDKFPDIAHTWGLDLGFTVDPCTLTKYAEDRFNIYIELKSYQPIDNADEVDALLKSVGVGKNEPITADSADKYTSETKGTVLMVRELFNMGWAITKVSKKKNVMFWLASMKTKKIHIVRNHLYQFAKIEAQNYRLKEVNGIYINMPEDKHNHMWDSARYAHMAHSTNNLSVNWD